MFMIKKRIISQEGKDNFLAGPYTENPGPYQTLNRLPFLPRTKSEGPWNNGALDSLDPTGKYLR